jgi:hypothetical protein
MPINIKAQPIYPPTLIISLRIIAPPIALNTDSVEKTIDAKGGKGTKRLQERVTTLKALEKKSRYNRKTKSYEVSAEELDSASSAARQRFDKQIFKASPNASIQYRRQEVIRAEQRLQIETAKNERINKKFASRLNKYVNVDKAIDAIENGTADESVVDDIIQSREVSMFYLHNQLIWEGTDPEHRNDIILEYYQNKYGAERFRNMEDVWSYDREVHKDEYERNKRYWKLFYMDSAYWSDDDAAFMDEYADAEPYTEASR